VLIDHAHRIINFAHGQMGVFGALLLGLAVVRCHLPYWAEFPLAIGISCLVGAIIEAAVVRRLRNAPKLMSLVATLGAGSLLAALASTIGTQANAFFSLYPQPPGLPVFNVGALSFTQAYTSMLILNPLAVLGLAAFLR